MKKQELTIIFTALALIFIYASASYSAEKAGEVLAVKNNAYLVRENVRDNAKPQMELFMKDAVETEKRSRTKLFFKDDSVLNLGELSRVEVQEYMYNADTKRSKSIYKLIDGSLRVVVGRSDLEVHTSTAVAASRGTKFIIWSEYEEEAADNIKPEQNNMLASRNVTKGIYLAAGSDKSAGRKRSSSTCIKVIEGKVDLRNIEDLKNIDPAQKKKLTVDEGNTACVPEYAVPELRFGESGAPGDRDMVVFTLFKEDQTDLPALAPQPSAFPDADITPPQHQQEPPTPPSVKMGNFERIDGRGGTE
jgi:hypothetical protein